MKKAVSFPYQCWFTIVFFAATAIAPAGDIDGNTYLQLQSQRDAAIQSLSGNAYNYSNREKTTNNENSIDPDQYYIGGGDQLVLSVIGLPSIHYSVEINQQGDMYIPELGLLKLGKITLTEAQHKITSFIREKLKKQNEIYVQLNKVKTVTVTVNGAVDNPGTYVFSGTNRILDAIRLANKDKLPSINDNNFREVICKNRDSIKTIDLFEYLLKNDISGNPYLYPGDNLSLLLATKRVYLNAVTKSGIAGWVPIKENENLGGFLALQRFDFSVDTTTVIYQSLGENSTRSIRSIPWKDAESVILHDRDIVTLPGKKNHSPVYLVTISGEVARPGIYSIIRDSTTAQDILASAGSPTVHANMDRAIIIRNFKIEQEQQNRSTGAIEKAQETKGIRPEIMSGLEKMFMTGDFSILELKRVGTGIKLEENDRIFVPVKEKVVYISGNVARPGAYEYVAGKNKNFYIHNAGGYTQKASKSNVFGMRYYDKVCTQIDLREILDGDIIIVPESQQWKSLSTVILPVIGLVLSTIGTIVTIITISKN